MDSEKLQPLFAAFDTNDVFLSAEAYGSGHINDTYKISGAVGAYTLQRINTNVFKDPDRTMENIIGITDHIAGKYRSLGIDPDRRTLRVIKTVDGGLCHHSAYGVYRMYNFVDSVKIYRILNDESIFYRAALAYGKFQSMLADYPADKLHETIKDFHNTPKRYKNLRQAVNDDKVSRVGSVLREIEYFDNNADFYSVVTDALADGTVPLRVTHNDTKLDNILFDESTDEGICIIDLDTVMPGSALYDFGDALRVGMNPCAEDEPEYGSVSARIPMFYAFASGYLEVLGGVLTERELELLPYAGRLMTLECAMRFLTDYLDGDVYFKTSREGQNLDRARVGIALAEDMKNHESEMKSIVNEIRKELNI